MKAEYRKYLNLPVKTVRVQKQDGCIYIGRIEGLHNDGSLLLKTEENRIEYVFSGDRIIYD
jgi:biotin-(acetyl-CoA carboxylase) ligase